ncbi:uncharacterized protein [Rutidosis leptorrhynchoides]|uniref:uncharacterized protein n=1 Tax=Rutidosis leptorrhynchoides TaxID=125765 RepID=UPI003A99E064
MDLKRETKSPITKFNHLQIPLEDVLEATNNFDDKNVIGHGGLGKVYQGRMFRSGKWVKIAARRFDRKHKHGIEFLREISALSSLKHENIVSLIGFCDEKDEKVIIIKRESKGSLEMHLSKPNLTWIQRLKISNGVARALSYIHNEGSLIHLNINSSTILLDNKFEPKLSGFEYSINHSVHRMDEVLYTEAFGTKGYMDPEIGKTGGVTHKSDIYSFGVILLEIIIGRKSFIPNADDKFLVTLAKFKNEKEELLKLIEPSLYSQMGQKSCKTYLLTALFCLKDERVQRPDMKYIVNELENALELQMPYEPPHPSLIRTKFEDPTSQLSHLKIKLADITLATDNFSDKYSIFKTTQYHLYRAEIELWDKENFPSIEEKNKSEWSKKRTTVIIKRLLSTQDKHGEDVFFTDIIMLTTCKHRNIATLLGICDEGSEKILIVEDAYNGYLVSYLNNKKDKSILTWEKRLKICLDVAYGLKYLQHEMEDQNTVINRYISPFSIALDENFRAKIVDFGSSVFFPPNLDALYFCFSSNNPLYVDPEYKKSGKLKRALDVYSFGLVLFEMFCGRLARDEMYMTENEDGLAYVARQCFLKGTFMQIIDPLFKTKGPNKDSIDTFTKIAIWCLAENQDHRPSMKVVVEELEKALMFQQAQCQDSDQVVDGSDNSLGPKLTHEEPQHSAAQSTTWVNLKDNVLKHLKIRLSDIILASDNFAEAYLCRSESGYLFYRAELEHFDQESSASIEENNKSQLPKKRNTVYIKHFTIRQKRQRELLFVREIEKLTTCKHRNIVNLIGFCDEDPEMIMVFENTIETYLDTYLLDKLKPILTWAQRLKICLDVAYGLEYLHFGMKDQKVMIHRNIRSTTIALDVNLGARIDFLAFSILIPPHLSDSALYTKVIIGLEGYLDPEYEKTGMLKRESDIYSFGVLLCELLCGRVAHKNYFKENEKGLAYVVRRGFHEGTLKDIVDPRIMQQSGDEFTLIRGPNKNSFDTFMKIAVACLEETQDKRPTIKVAIDELKKALMFQENNKDALRISLVDIQIATENFHDKHCVGGGGFGKVYKGKLPQSDNTIVAKRLDTSGGQGDKQFRNELQILFEYRHDNIIGLVGFCDEKDAKVIVYEYAPRGSLDRYLSDARLTWMKRLNICIGVATALDFLHRGVGTLATVIHRDIKSENILLSGDWNAKLGDFGLSLICAINQETDYVIDHACGTEGYVDPVYLKSRFLTKESDIYSFGVVLFEILCGRSTFVIHKREGMHLPNFIKDRFEKGTHETVVFEKIKAQIMPEALSVFQMIAYECLNENREERPMAKEVVEQLKKALELQISRGDGDSSSTSYQLQD